MTIEQYKPIYGKEEADALHALVMSGSYLADYKKTQEFEEKIAHESLNNYAVAVNNGTLALSLALYASGVRAGDSVIVPNLTMIATATAVEFIGAVPIFCDIEQERLCLDVDLATSYLQVGANAVIYVSFNGRENFKKLKKLVNYCKLNNKILINDDAQSFGSLGVQSEQYGKIHTLSFSPHKIVSCGQGGAIVTSNKEIYEKIKRIKDFGRLQGGTDIHDYFGINSKFTEMQAVVGLCQLERLRKRIEFKHYIYELYYSYLSDYMFKYCGETIWMPDIYLPTRRLRDSLIEYLNEHNIKTRPMYPMLTSQKIYTSGFEYPISKRISETGLFLPCSFDLQEHQIINIAELIAGYLF